MIIITTMIIMIVIIINDPTKFPATVTLVKRRWVSWSQTLKEWQNRQRGHLTRWLCLQLNSNLSQSSLTGKS